MQLKTDSRHRGGKKLLIIDSHVHTGENWSEPVEVLLHQMDANGVSHAVLVGHNGNYDNAYLLECVRRYPGRFKAVGLVDAQDPNRSKALESFHKQGGSGIRINLRKENEWDPDNALFKAAGDLGHDRERHRRGRKFRFGPFQEAARQLSRHAFLPGTSGCAAPALTSLSRRIRDTGKRWNARAGRTPPSRFRDSARS